MRIAFVLPGLHRVARGAEIAFEAIAQELAGYNDCEVTLFGSGQARVGDPYRFIHVDNRDRRQFESWPCLPLFRTDYAYEELTFALNLLSKYQPDDFDATVTCSYPFLNWLLRRPGKKRRPAHIFVTQNSDYPAVAAHKEYRFFGCDSLVCTNPDYFERSKARWPSALITNGVDANKFHPGQAERAAFGLPEHVPLALMVSALIPSKRVTVGIKAAAAVAGLHLVICGNGPERTQAEKIAHSLMPGRVYFKQLSHEQMPAIYRAADVFLHLSLDEPFGNVYLEALATGLPIVGHDRDVTRWIVEDTATLVDSHELSQVSAGLKNALEADTEAARLARAELVNKRFQWSQIGSLYHSLIADTINPTAAS